MAFPLYQNGKKIIRKRTHTNSMLGSSSGQFGPICANSMPSGAMKSPCQGLFILMVPLGLLKRGP